MAAPGKTALIVVDFQNDFCDGGSLAVPRALEITAVVNALKARKDKFEVVVLTQDWHPKDHVSFVTNHADNPSAKLFQPLDLGDGRLQMMWPAHCQQNAFGAEFHSSLKVEGTDIVVRKGTNPQIDSYSGFFDNDHKNKTELDRVLRERGVATVYCVGLAFDYCVGYTALDARSLGYETFVIEDATRGIAEDSIGKMREQLQKSGVRLISSKALLG